MRPAPSGALRFPEDGAIDGSGPRPPAKRIPHGRRALFFTLGIWLFILALELTRGAGGALRAIVPLDGSTGVLSAFGLGWLLASIFLSGSPVAAVSLGLFAAETIDSMASYAMIMGSRVGASFVVLLIGFVYDVQARKAPRGTPARGGVYLGAVALLVTASVYLPAFAAGSAIVSARWLEGLAPMHLGKGIAIIDILFGPVVRVAEAALPATVRALAGIGLILVAFRVFDAGLPGVDPTGGKLGRMATTIYRPPIAFLFGLALTAVTLSVSVSLALLVPLTVRGVVRRENLIPFILGANISTFVDTLAASLLVGHAGAFPIVVAAVLVVSGISLPLVFLAYRSYETLIDGAASWIVRRKLRVGALVALLFAVPVALVLLPRLCG